MSKTDEATRTLKKRQIIEGAVIFSLYKDCSLFEEYKLSDNDFITPEGKLLYNLGKLVNARNVDFIDKTAIDLELEKHPEFKDKINEFGGSRAIIQSMNGINKENIELYYNDLMKYNYLKQLSDKGFDISRYENKFDEMSFEDVKDFMEYTVINTEISTTMVGKGVEVVELEFTDEIFNEIISGEVIPSVDFGEYAHILNNIFMGLPLKMTTMLSAPSGVGKSSFILSNMVYPVIKKGNPIILISNELAYKQYLVMLIAIVSVREFKSYALARKKINTGNLKEEDIEMLRKVQTFINTELKGAIKFINYNSGDIGVVKKMMKKYSKLGCQVAVFDTMKTADSANGKAWAQLIEDSKQLDWAAQETNMALILSFQIAPSAGDKRSLSRSDLSEGKSVINVITNHVILRKVKRDEFNGGKYDIKPYKLVRNKTTNKWEREYIPFGEECKDQNYIIAAVDKTRMDAGDQNILYKFNGAWCIYEEIGYCTPSLDYK